ncbi:hypothetical protein BDY21DRAFT_79735 [Lineolata rhizophorae]|uniref:Uncharacterized protein n=1 Tax=Lineolata rhizophorae TaxID=578093 RepID=A0A6A6NTP0_9PEZI|nr:hypothetical protein BDY21DRAFT_79735 [Lineolata rhizophorae]
MISYFAIRTTDLIQRHRLETFTIDKDNTLHAPRRSRPWLIYLDLKNILAINIKLNKLLLKVDPQNSGITSELGQQDLHCPFQVYTLSPGKGTSSAIYIFPAVEQRISDRGQTRHRRMAHLAMIGCRAVAPTRPPHIGTGQSARKLTSGMASPRLFNLRRLQDLISVLSSSVFKTLKLLVPDARS